MSIYAHGFRRLCVLLLHAALVAVSLLLAFSLRFDFRIPHPELANLYTGLLVAIPLKSLVFHLGGLTRGRWRYAGMPDLVRIYIASIVSSALFTGTVLGIVGWNFPRSVYLIDFLLCFLMLCAFRFAVRVYYEGRFKARSTGTRKRVLVYGAGRAGLTLLREIEMNPALGLSVVGLLDDDTSKTGMSLHGVRVLGRGRDAAAIAERCERRGRKIDEVVIALPSANSQQMREVIANCRAAQLRCKTIPSVGELLTGAVLTSQLREISVDDLLGRAPVRIEESRVRQSVAGRVVMITGAAGSIGSELCRQIAAFGPAKLIAFDQAESDLFTIDLELRGSSYNNLNLVSIVGDIRDQARVDQVIRENGVQAIYHAAAYKHVPLMEVFPLEALRTNVIATWNLVRSAYRNGVATFVMISSDKAVQPSSIMGATKRLAELILSAMPNDQTRFVSVRFGNVLGSNGSVVPIFQSQIAAGGPVTVTDPEMRRFFMTIREAVQLVLIASTMGQGSEIFVLDMGEPVKIVDLAKNMIRLAGKREDEIEIRFTGIRSGEKLYEEVTYGEDVLPTAHRKIRVFKGPQADRAVVENGLALIEEAIEARDATAGVRTLCTLVPEFRPAKAWDRPLMRGA